MDITTLLGIIIGIIFVFAIFDLVVGVSNDAINFLSPSVGSKVAGYKVIMIIAALGLLAGSLFSSGLMEVARKGIFYPQYFNLMEVITIFLAVIIADILLLNKFNSIGLPTSTTVSIVFCLLGGAVGMGVIKLTNEGSPISDLATLINTAKVLTIILGILGSVLAAFILGSIVQFFTRIVFTFDFEKKPKFWSAMLGAVAFTAITHFIVAKGLKGSAFSGYDSIIGSINNNLLSFIAITSIAWFLLLEFFLLLKVNIFKLVVLAGTFSLAMAFAGNDLVNFIGVPLAALKSFQLFLAEPTITDPNVFFMSGLNTKEQAPLLLLLLSGCIMVATLILSKKAKKVLQTGLNLANQHAGKESFGYSRVADLIVRQFSLLINMVASICPKRVSKFVTSRFKHIKSSKKDKQFDYIRASVVLLCSSILISIATSYNLPLSTTYVTFMVAMGAAFADRSWGKDSAVYRVNGVITVIFGWFITAFGAFLLAFLLASGMYYGGVIIMSVLSLYTCYIMISPLFRKSK